ncbi:peptidase inhibitor family I36 protein [Stackebrandtia soli]|uniref:peptidase inhibitor family I36 protein n=1 Tax=Stackebrandtia soli TaxID=1892856 RepID=UPI0039EBA2A7
MQQVMRAVWAAAAGATAAMVMAAPALAAGTTYPVNSFHECHPTSVCVWEEPEFIGQGIGHFDPDPNRCYSGQVQSLFNRAMGDVVVFDDPQCQWPIVRVGPDQARPFVPGQSWMYQPF